MNQFIFYGVGILIYFIMNYIFPEDKIIKKVIKNGR